MWTLVLAMTAGAVIVLIAGLVTLLVATSHGSGGRQGGAQVALVLLGTSPGVDGRRLLNALHPTVGVGELHVDNPG